ncbi:hypothetical protein IID10_11525 [candidate division KSB1 bacterium]|nr:hypothetical protein [candidate division KSB1 bacterium]
MRKATGHKARWPLKKKGKYNEYRYSKAKQDKWQVYWHNWQTQHRKVTIVPEVTAGARGLAGMYFYMKLDCLISLAGKVSDDFFSKRPHLYSQLQARKDVDLARILATLKARTGYHELFPSLEQRNDIYLRYFGRPGDLTSKFYQVTQPLLAAARKFSKSVSDQTISKNVLRGNVPGRLDEIIELKGEMK